MEPARTKKFEEWKYWNSFSVSKWYPFIEKLTFPSSFISISLDEARSIIKYQELVCEKYIDSPDLPPYDDPLLEELENRLENAVQFFGCGAFVKMSDRSPKDAATERGRIQAHLDQYLRPVCVGGEGNYLNNWVALPAVYRAYMSALRVTSGREALQLILVSFRTLEDLKERVAFADELWELEIVIREWRNFDISYEFRGFCCHNKFTALSQYYFDCYIEGIEKNKEKIELAIYGFWEAKVKNSLSEIYERGYVIDFAYIPETEEVFVIELNPFDASTDASCFSWVLNRKVLEGETDTGFQFKIINQSGKKSETGRKSNWWIKLVRDWKKSTVK